MTEVMPQFVEGSLKQQCIDENGLFDWVRKVFRLDIDSGTLSEFDPANFSFPQTSYTLDGVKFAKEWSVTSSIAGYGFDVIWTSGKVWSFLADDEISCAQWVSGINEIQIRLAQMSQTDLASNATTEVDPKSKVRFREVPRANTEAINLLQQQEGSPFSGLNVSEIPKASSDGSPSQDSDNSANRQQSMHMSHLQGDHSTESVTNPVHESAFVGTDSAGRASGHPMHESVFVGGESGGSNQTLPLYTTPSAARKQAADPADEQGEKIPQAYVPTAPIDSIELSHEFQRLRLKSERDEAALAELRSKLSRVYNDSENSIHDLEIQLDHANEKVRDVTTQLREAEGRLLRSSAESSGTRQAVMRGLEEQHTHELTCLKDELVAERRRYAGLLQEESQKRVQAEGAEVELQHEMDSMRNQLNNIQFEYKRMSDRMNHCEADWEEEKNAIAAAHDDEVSKLRNELMHANMLSKADLTVRISELTEEFNIAIKNSEVSVREAAIAELAGQRLKEIAEMQRQCTRDVEKARTEERRNVAVDMNKLRQKYQEREKQTADDLEQLEALHVARVEKLERQLHEYKAQNAALLDQCSRHKVASEKADATVKELVSAHRVESEDNVVKSHQISLQLDRALKQLQEAKAREVTYRNEMSAAIEEARILRAELMELREQASSGNAQAQMWRKVAEDSNTNTTTSATQLQIAHEEIAMLENELYRSRDEILSLKASLERADKIVYGSSHLRGANAFKVPISKQDMAIEALRKGKENHAYSSHLLRSIAQEKRERRGGSGTKQSVSFKPSPLQRGRAKVRGHGRYMTHSGAQGSRSHSPGGPRPRSGSCSRSPQRCYAAATIAEMEAKEKGYYNYYNL
jgi:hypothetical protein